MTTDFDFAVDDQPQTPAEREAQQKAARKERAAHRWRRRWRVFKTGFRTGFILLLVGLFIWIFRENIFYSVDSGEVLLVYYRLFGGTSHNQIGHEGLHIIAPWDKAYRYSIRTQTILLPMTVLSRDGLEVQLDAQIRFAPRAELVPYLHRRYGPNYANDIIIPQLTEAVQAVIGQFHAEELYSFQRAASVGRIFAKARRIIGGVYVGIDDIALFNIKLPDTVNNAIQAKVAADQTAQAQAFLIVKEQFEAKRKEVEARGLQQYNELLKSIPKDVLTWKGIEATLELAKSPNAKLIVIGAKDNLPLVLGGVPEVTGK